jgi:hypothetical protein
MDSREPLKLAKIFEWNIAYVYYSNTGMYNEKTLANAFEVLTAAMNAGPM